MVQKGNRDKETEDLWMNKKQLAKMTMSAVLIVIVVMGGVSCEKSIRLDKLSIPMAKVAGGSFQMGSNDYSNEQPIHKVTVGSFYMGTYEVTQDIYEQVMGNNPSNWKGAKLPVEQVRWYDAVAFANALSRRDGLDEVYTIDGTDVSIDWTKRGYRLPTEAEWEYAARGGNQSQGYTYGGSNTAGDVAWYGGNSGDKTHEVGIKQANELGLYDMSGNVWEWCWDWYGDYSELAQTNPTGSSSGSFRVLRGGSWINNTTYGRTADRYDFTPSSRYDHVGFRVLVPAK
jgi:formylglycine-generating enzyme